MQLNEVSLIVFTHASSYFAITGSHSYLNYMHSLFAVLLVYATIHYFFERVVLQGASIRSFGMANTKELGS